MRLPAAFAWHERGPPGVPLTAKLLHPAAIASKATRLLDHLRVVASFQGIHVTADHHDTADSTVWFSSMWSEKEVGGEEWQEKMVSKKDSRRDL